MRRLLVLLLSALALVPALVSDVEVASARGAAPPPVAYELSAPSGKFRGRAPRGLMLVVHGGGWLRTGVEIVRAERPNARRFQERGWATLNVTYRPGSASIGDVRAFYDWARRRFGPKLPICAYGSSAGGHLALMLAAARPDLRCVIANGAPTDLDGLQGTPWTDALRRDYIVPSFGAGRLATVSPLTYAARTRAEVLLLHAVTDQLVPSDQATAYARLARHAQVFVMRGGAQTWVHADVDADDLRRSLVAESALMRRAERGWSR